MKTIRAWSPMSVAWRYVLREHVGPFFFGFGMITLVFVLNLVFRELGRILSKGLPVSVILEFFALNLAWIVALAVPMAVLTACLMAFGRLSSDNEITAFKAGGVSLIRLITPVFLAACLLAIGLIWFNNHVLPEANHRARLLASDISRKRPTVSLEPGVVYRGIPDFGVLVERIVEHEHVSKAWGIIIDDHSEEGIRKTIVADSGEIRVDPRTGLLHLTLYSGEIHEVHLDDLYSYRRLQFPKHRITLRVPGMVLVRRESEYRGDREKSAAMMLQEIRETKNRIAQRQQKIASSVVGTARKYLPWLWEVTDSSRHRPETTMLLPAVDVKRARADHLRLLGEIESEQAVIRSYRRTINSLLVEVHKKYSIPVACLVFVLVGAPLGAAARRGGMAVGMGIGLFFFLLYWAFLMGGEQLADRGIITPFWAMWSPNVVVGLAGVYLLIRSVRETTFILWEEWLKCPHLIRREEE